MDVIDCINKVSSELGKYYKENIYQNALFIELTDNKFRITY